MVLFMNSSDQNLPVKIQPGQFASQAAAEGRYLPKKTNLSVAYVCRVLKEERGLIGPTYPLSADRSRTADTGAGSTGPLQLRYRGTFFRVKSILSPASRVGARGCNPQATAKRS